MRALKLTAAWLAAVVATALLGSVAQTQFNLAALQALGVPMPLDVRFGTTARDLAGFGPTFAALTALAFLIAFVFTGVLRRWVKAGRNGLYALAGAVAIAAMILIMTAIFELVPIAAARGAVGLATLALSGAFGGWLFARLSERPAATA